MKRQAVLTTHNNMVICVATMLLSGVHGRRLLNTEHTFIYDLTVTPFDYNNVSYASMITGPSVKALYGCGPSDSECSWYGLICAAFDFLDFATTTTAKPNSTPKPRLLPWQCKAKVLIDIHAVHAVVTPVFTGDQALFEFMCFFHVSWYDLTAQHDPVSISGCDCILHYSDSRKTVSDDGFNGFHDARSFSRVYTGCFRTEARRVLSLHGRL